MDQTEVVRCPDQNYRQAIWGFGPYIGDYPEQTLLACIVQGWCARYSLLALVRYGTLIDCTDVERLPEI